MIISVLCCQHAPVHDGAVPGRALLNHTQICCRDFIRQVWLPGKCFNTATLLMERRNFTLADKSCIIASVLKIQEYIPNFFLL